MSGYLGLDDQLMLAERMRHVRKAVAGAAREVIGDYVSNYYLVKPDSLDNYFTELKRSCNNGGPTDDLMDLAEFRGRGMLVLQRERPELLDKDLEEEINEYFKARDSLLLNIKDWITKRIIDQIGFYHEDLYQDIILRVMVAIDGYDPEKRCTLISFINPYLSSTIRRLAYDDKFPHTSLYYDDGNERPFVHKEVERDFERLDHRIAVEQLISCLSPSQKIVIKKRLGGMTMEKIAEILGCTKQRVHQIITSAINQMRSAELNGLGAHSAERAPETPEKIKGLIKIPGLME